MYCQKCRVPLKFDNSLENLNPAAYDLLVGPYRPPWHAELPLRLFVGERLPDANSGKQRPPRSRPLETLYPRGPRNPKRSSERHSTISFRRMLPARSSSVTAAPAKHLAEIRPCRSYTSRSHKSRLHRHNETPFPLRKGARKAGTPRMMTRTRCRTRARPTRWSA